jgi:hypothetical protein
MLSILPIIKTINSLFLLFATPSSINSRAKCIVFQIGFTPPSSRINRYFAETYADYLMQMFQK